MVFSVRNYTKPKCPIVKWGGIQTILEEAPNDVLILLDCCASGTANASEGNGVNELISACAFNETANGVGPYSFTSALVTELRLLGNRPSFSVGELYKKIFFRTQCRMPEELYADGTERERHPAPIHLVLTQGVPVPRSIQLPAKVGPQRLILTTSTWHPPISWGCNGSTFFENGTTATSNSRNSSVSGPSTNPDTNSTAASSTPEISDMLHYQRGPRLLFAIRMRETFEPGEDMVELFAEWMRGMPAIADEVNVEASFDSYSTIVIISLPVSVAAYLPHDPSIISLGPITSENRVSLPGRHQMLRSSVPYYVHQRNNSEPGPRRKSHTNEHPGHFIGDFVPSAQSSLSAILDLLPKVNEADLPIIVDSIETLKRLTGAYEPSAAPDSPSSKDVKNSGKLAKLGIVSRSTKNFPKSIPRSVASIPIRPNEPDDTTDFNAVLATSIPPLWDYNQRMRPGNMYSIGDNRESYQSLSSLSSFETDSSLKSQRSSTSTVATRLSHFSDFTPQNSARFSSTSQARIDEPCSPLQPKKAEACPTGTVCTAPNCKQSFPDHIARGRHEDTVHKLNLGFTCLLDACTSSCSFPCFQICHFKPFQTDDWDLLRAHLQKEHPTVRYTLETLPLAWTGRYEHTGSGWNCGHCSKFLGSWKEDSSAIMKHFEICPWPVKEEVEKGRKQSK